MLFMYVILPFYQVQRTACRMARRRQSPGAQPGMPLSEKTPWSSKMQWHRFQCEATFGEKLLAQSIPERLLALQIAIASGEHVGTVWWTQMQRWSRKHKGWSLCSSQGHVDMLVDHVYWVGPSPLWAVQVPVGLYWLQGYRTQMILSCNQKDVVHWLFMNTMG